MPSSSSPECDTIDGEKMPDENSVSGKRKGKAKIIALHRKHNNKQKRRKGKNRPNKVK